MKDWSGKSGRKSVNAMEKVAPANVLLDRDLQNFLRICPSFFLLFCLHSKTLVFIYGSVSHVQEGEDEKNTYTER